MLFVEGSSETRLFRHLSNHVFWSPEFRKYIGYEGHLFLKKFQNLMYISEMERKIEQGFFVSEITVSELIALNCLD